MKEIVKLFKDIFIPKQIIYKYIKYKYICKTQKEKSLVIADCVERLNQNIVINGQNTKH